MALEMFEREGFEATTVEQIASAADIAPRTFFHYFETKDDVVLGDYADRLTRIVSALAERPVEERPWSALRRSFVIAAEDYENERFQLFRRFRLMADTPSVFTRSLQLQAGWEDRLSAALAERIGVDLDSDMSPRLYAAAALAAMRAAMRHWLATGASEPLPAEVGRCFDQLGRGLDAVPAAPPSA